MPLYHYRCPNCRDTFLRHTSMDKATELVPCPSCLDNTKPKSNDHGTAGGTVWLNRVYDFAYHADIPEHFSQSTGTPIRGKRHYAEELRRLSDEATERTGVLHNFVPTDMTQPASLGVTSEGLEHTFKTKRDQGIRSGEDKVAKWL